MLWISFLLLCCVNGLQNPYKLAAQCADDLLDQFPTLPNKWIYSNGTFGGRESPYYVGWVDHSDSSMPNINMMDGPQGLRDILDGVALKDRTSWPGAATYGMAWSPEFAFYAGKFGASDWAAVNANVALTPGVNVHRLPINGRNWEYISGEDPYLGTLAAPLIHGLQSGGMMGSLKHFVLNNQELNREAVISSIDEATLMETYLRAFQPAIDAGVGSVMCSYNQIEVETDSRSHPGGSHSYTCGSEILNHTLRGIMGFKGAWMTDWNAQVLNTTDNITTVQRQFVDWEMRWGSAINLIVPKESYKPIIRNVLTGMFASGILKNTSVPSCNVPGVKIPTKIPSIDHLPTQYQTAIKSNDIGDFSAILVAEAMVLLKNAPDVLPLQESSQRILLTGTSLLNGGGSGDSSAFGYDAPNHLGEGLHNGGKVAQDLMVANIHKYTGAVVEWDFEVTNLKLDNYDAILAFGAQFRSETYLVNNTDGYYNIDQCDSSKNFSLYGDCDYLGFLEDFQKARRKGTNVISITTTGGIHFPDYLHLVDAAITLIYPGEYFARALSKVLSGQISPGGKLTYTLPDLEDDKVHIQSPVGRFNSGLSYDRNQKKNYTLKYPAYLWDHKKKKPTNIIQYDSTKSTYAEKNLVGYKYYEKFDMVPLFEFGYGLSYVKYEVTPSFTNCQSHSSCKIGFNVNLDDRHSTGRTYSGIGSEVLQIYIGYETAIPNEFLPAKELRAFRKVWKEGTYIFKLEEDAFKSVWNIDDRTWDYPCEHYPGWFTVFAATSSRQILGSINLSC